MTHSFDAALTTAEAGHTFDYYGCGIHWWPYWQRDLHAFWPKMLHAFGDRPPPTFDFRRVDPLFSVWGWIFTADPRRAPEFVTIHHASPRGLTVTGSGTETIRTPRLFKPRERVRAAGTGTKPQTLLADRAGRLTFTVALGPPHGLQQYTPAEEQAATARDYFRTRTIHLTRQHARTRLPRRAHPHRDPDNDNDHDRPGQR